MTKKKKFLYKIRTKPIFYFNRILGCETLEEYQEQIIEDFVEYDRIAIAACHSVGKTFLMARLALYFVNIWKGAKVITTAPTHRQVEKLLWGELRKAHKSAKYPLGGHLTNTELKINDDWFAMGFSPKREAGEGEAQQSSSFQGFHSNYILIIFDEATGIHPDVWKMAEGLLTSGKIVKFVCIANPTRRDCDFFKCFKMPDWHKIYLSCFDSPNLKANGITDKKKLIEEVTYLKTLEDIERLKRIKSYAMPVTHLLSCQWVMQSALRWGINHPLFLSKVLGEFPKESDNTIIQLGDVENAIQRKYKVKQKDKRSIGIDVARFGEDSTVFTEIVGNKVTRKRVLYHRDIAEVTGEAINFIREIYYIRKTKVFVDATGVGSGVVDMLLERKREGVLSDKVDIIEVHNAAKCEDTDNLQFLNLRAKMFYQLGELVKTSIDLLDEDVYLEELISIQYKYNSAGKMLIESKDDYKKRTGNGSPDHADSLALASLGLTGTVAQQRVYHDIDDSIICDHSNIMAEIAHAWRNYRFICVAMVGNPFSVLVVAVNKYTQKLYPLADYHFEDIKLFRTNLVKKELDIFMNELTLEWKDMEIYYKGEEWFATEMSNEHNIFWVPLDKSYENIGHSLLKDQMEKNKIAISDKCRQLLSQLSSVKDDDKEIPELVQCLLFVESIAMLDTKTNKEPIEDIQEQKDYIYENNIVDDDFF